SKKVVNGFRQMREQNRLFPLFIQWMGFKTAYVPIQHDERTEGKSSYNIKKLITLGTDVLISQSNKPLRLSIQFGLLVSFISLLYGVYLYIRYFFLAVPVLVLFSVLFLFIFFIFLFFFIFFIFFI